MKKFWSAIAVALLVTGCGGKGFMGGNRASVEQRDPFEKQETAKSKEADAAQKDKEFQILKEQEELKAKLAAQQAQAEKDAAAAKAKEDEAKAAGRKPGAGGGDEGENPMVAPLPATTLTEQALKESATAMNDPSNPLSRRSIYFGYDSIGVEGDYQQVVEAHAKFLTDHPQVKLRLEGNTDIRGSREYNLALGQRRADAVKKAFTLLGVSPGQLESVSFGKEKPRAMGDGEDAHQENRRVDMFYTGLESVQ